MWLYVAIISSETNLNPDTKMLYSLLDEFWKSLDSSDTQTSVKKSATNEGCYNTDVFIIYYTILACLFSAALLLFRTKLLLFFVNGFDFNKIYFNFIILKDQIVLDVSKAIKGSIRYKCIKWGIFAVGISVFAQLYNLQPLLPAVTKYFRVTPFQSSLMVSVSSVGMALGLLLFTFIADRFLRKEVILFALFSSALLTFVSVFISNFNVLIVVSFLKGVCLSGVSAVTLAYLAEEIDTSSVGEAIGFYLAGNTFGGMLGRIAAALIGDWFGWRIAVLAIGIIALAMAIIFTVIFPNSNYFNPINFAIKQKVAQLKGLLVQQQIIVLYLLATFLMGSFVSVYNYLGFKLEAEPYHLPQYLIALIFLMYAFGVLGNFIGGYLLSKYAPEKCLCIMLLFFLGGLILLSLSNIFLILIGLFMLTLSFFCAHTLAGGLVTFLAKGSKTAATALYWFFYYIGAGFVGSVLGIFINHNNWNGFFLTLICLALFLLISVFWAFRKNINFN